MKLADIRRPDKVSISKVNKHVSEIVKFKNAMLKFDKSLLSNNGLHRRSSEFAIPYDFNKEVLDRIENREEDLSTLLHSLQEKLKATKEIFSGVSVKALQRETKGKTKKEPINEKAKTDRERCASLFTEKL